MLKTDLKTSVKSLYSQKFYSALNILGLSAGLAAFILIALYVRNEMSYDRSLPDADRVYRVVRNEYTLSPPPMAANIKESIPEIEFASRFILGNSLLLETGGRFFTEEKYFWTDNEFLSIFPLEFIRGNSAVALESPTDILLSESLARKYFGDNDPVGSLVTISRKDEYRVAGVFRDFPGNSHFSFNIVLPIDRYFEITGNDPASWRSNYVYTYVKLTPGAEIETVNKKYTDFEKVLTEWTPASGTPYSQYFFFQPVTEIHLFSHRKQEIEANSDISNVYIFISIGLLILVIAIINYINLATAMAGKKERSMALKKILGARKIQLARLVFIESFLVAIASIVLAAVIAYLTLPYFNSLMDRNISVGVGDMPVIIPGLLLLAILVGFVSGWAPSVTLTKVSLVSVLGSSTSTPRGGRSVRSILVLMQFIIAIILIIVTINMKEQLGYISSRNPGYDKTGIINMRIIDRSLRPNMSLLKEALRSEAGVVDVSTSYLLPHRITDFTRPDWFCEDPQTCQPIFYNMVDYDFVDLYNIEIVQGRNFSRDYPSDINGAFLVNETAVKMAGWDNPLGVEITHYDGRKGTIVGVVKDFNFESMHTEIAPLYMMLDENVSSCLSIRIDKDDLPGTIERIRTIFNRFSPDTPLNYTFFDEEFNQVYHQERRISSLFVFFSMLAIILGCLGMFGMAAFSISQMRKEMGVRKVFGATNRESIILVAKSFMTPVILANIIAWPLSWLILRKWLESFVYRTSISPVSFLIAALAVIAITLFTISLNSRRIALQAPADILRTQ